VSLKKSESPAPRRRGRYSEEFKRDAVTMPKLFATSTHPDSVEPLTALYDGRAYLPRADPQDLAVRVRRLVAQHRGRSTPSTRSRFVECPEAQGLGPGKAAPAAPSPGRQLPLFWGTEARCRRV